MDNKHKNFEISIVIPVYNEQENLKLLYEKISSSLKNLISYEIIFVDDGSNDNSFNILKELKSKDSNIKVIQFSRNFGQSSAWDAGIKASIGRYIVTMDADLQNDPSDIPLLLDKIKKGNYDVISGWRISRKDSISKKLFSKISNLLRRILTKEKIHDSGCSLKIYKRECFDEIDLYGEIHRYIISILSIKGFKIGEVKVKHNPRNAGKTKYGSSRLFKGALDLFYISFMYKYSYRPMHFFGNIGLINLFLGFIIGIYLIIVKFILGSSLLGRAAPIFSALLIIVGVQFLIFGILAEILMKVYHKITNLKPYLIKNEKH